MNKPECILYKLPERFVLTSDEEIKVNDLMLSDNNDIEFCISIEDYGYEGSKETIFRKDFVRKVIAQQDQITFSDEIPEEKLEEIGLFDIEKLAKEFLLQKGIKDTLYDVSKNDGSWIKGGLSKLIADFQKEEGLLSDRRFTLEDMKKAFLSGRELSENTQPDTPVKDVKPKYSFNSYIQPITQPKSWEVEIEMETKCYCGHTTTCDCGQVEGKPFIQTPKFTNGKIKILRIL